MSNRLSRSLPKLCLGAATLTLCLVPTIVQAHTGVDHVSGFSAGLQHPISGLDHLLTMVAVGLWAVQLGGRARWALPLGFVSLMAVGGLLGLSGVALPGIEVGIIGSNLLLGALVLWAARLPLGVSVALVGVSALFHGAAHGLEIPQSADALSYAIGLLLATVGLHLAGLGLAQLCQMWGRDRWVKLAGMGVLLGGVAGAMGLLFPAV
jgi:urease accessory protein